MNIHLLQLRCRSPRTGVFHLVAGLLLGLVAVAGTAQAQPVKLGAILALTGPAAGSNRSAVLGMRVAVEEINKAGGILGDQVSLMLFDNLSTPIGSRSAALEAVRAGVTAIVGAQWSSHSLPIAEVAQANAIPMVSHFSTSPRLTRIGEYIFRICYTDIDQGRIMAEFARNDLQAQRATLFIELHSEYSLDVSEIFRSHFEAMGGMIVKEVEYKATQWDFDTLAAEVDGSASDVIFLSGHDESGQIAASLIEAGIRIPLIGGDGWDVDTFFERGGNRIEEGYFSTHWHPSVANPVSRHVVQQYGRRPGFSAGTVLAYDAVKLVADAIARAGTTEGEAVRNALQATAGFSGATGNISFNEVGDPLKDILIMAIRNGRTQLFKTYNLSNPN